MSCDSNSKSCSLAAGIPISVKEQAWSNAIVSTGEGFVYGLGSAFLLFVVTKGRQNRAFPVLLGTGFGAGNAYSEANYSFNNYRYKNNVVVTEQPGVVSRFICCVKSQISRV